MNIDVERIHDRFKNLLEVKNERQLDEIRTTFTEYELKALIWVLGDYMTIKENKDAITTDTITEYCREHNYILCEKGTEPYKGE